MGIEKKNDMYSVKWEKVGYTIQQNVKQAKKANKNWIPPAVRNEMSQTYKNYD